METQAYNPDPQIFRSVGKDMTMTTVRPSERAIAFDRQALIRGRNNGPALLVEWILDGRLTVHDLDAVLPSVWTSAEWPERNLSTRVWVGLFRSAGYLTSDVNQPPPTEPLRLYRGAVPRRRRGMAWTTEPEQALWFANRWALLLDTAHVFTVMAPPQAVLARFDEDESEVVVDPSLLPRTTRWSG